MYGVGLGEIDEKNGIFFGRGATSAIVQIATFFWLIASILLIAWVFC